MADRDPYCPEAELRASMTDQEFWEHVARSFAPPASWDSEPSEIDVEDIADMSHLANPCPECGQWGACAYDQEGRAMIHATGADG